jgi:hypothetical protein
MSVYNFTKPNIIFLHLLENNLTLINLTPYNIIYVGNIVTITYNYQLSNEEITTLNNYMDNYIPESSEPIEFFNSINIQLNNPIINNIEWMLIGSHRYLINNSGEIRSINIGIVSKVDLGTYEFRVFNYSNNSIIGTSGNLNNTTKDICTININTIPNNDSIIEIHSKASSNIGNCVVESCQLNLFI